MQETHIMLNVKILGGRDVLSVMCLASSQKVNASWCFKRISEQNLSFSLPYIEILMTIYRTWLQLGLF